MIVVLDANVLISALLRDSSTRRILLSSEDMFICPAIILEEMGVHRRHLLQKSGLTGDEFDGLLKRLLKYVSLIPSDVLLPFREEAFRIMGHIDPKDVLYIAAALAFEGAVIWSNDRHFEEQETVKIYKTSDMILRING